MACCRVWQRWLAYTSYVMGPLLLSGGAPAACVSTRMQLNHMAAPSELSVRAAPGRRSGPDEPACTGGCEECNFEHFQIHFYTLLPAVRSSRKHWKMLTIYRAA